MGIVFEDIRVTTPIEERCDICHKEIAVYECDMPTSYVKAIIRFCTRCVKKLRSKLANMGL